MLVYDLPVIKYNYFGYCDNDNNRSIIIMRVLTLILLILINRLHANHLHIIVYFIIHQLTLHKLHTNITFQLRLHGYFQLYFNHVIIKITQHLHYSHNLGIGSKTTSARKQINCIFQVTHHTSGLLKAPLKLTVFYHIFTCASCLYFYIILSHRHLNRYNTRTTISLKTDYG